MSKIILFFTEFSTIILVSVCSKLDGTDCHQNNIYRIIGGQPVLEDSWPFIAMLVITQGPKETPRTSMCGGSLLTKDWVLTAGHCIDVEKPNIKIKIGAGEVFNKNEKSHLNDFIPAEYIVPHPKLKGFIIQKDAITRYDICLIKLNRSVILSGTNDLVKLPKEGLPIGSHCIVAGRGAYALDFVNETYKPLLRENMALYEIEEQTGDCSFLYEYFHNISTTERQINPESFIPDLESLFEDKICIKPQNNIGVCAGDSGGPLICNGLQYGVVSGGIPVNTTYIYNYYTAVHKHLDWINSTINEPADSPKLVENKPSKTTIKKMYNTHRTDITHITITTVLSPSLDDEVVRGSSSSRNKEALISLLFLFDVIYIYTCM